MNACLYWSSFELCGILDDVQAVLQSVKSMNAMLEKAFDAVSRLPEAEQESIAGLILEEIEAERGWDERFAGSQDQLAEMVRRARAEVAAGDVFPTIPQTARQSDSANRPALAGPWISRRGCCRRHGDLVLDRITFRL